MTAWVIGGTSGIGEACALKLREIVDPNDFVHTTGKDDFDVTSDNFERMLEKLGYPDKIVYSAGINHLNWLGKGTLDEHLRVIDVNLFGFIRLVDAAASIGKTGFPIVGDDRKYKPSIVAISSDAATRPLRTSISYCASKAGLDMAVRCAARELGPHGWRINAVAPGMTEHTKMTEYIDNRVPEVRGWSPRKTEEYEVSQEVVPGRVDKWEVAEAVKFLLDAGPHVNGVILPVNGGR